MSWRSQREVRCVSPECWVSLRSRCSIAKHLHVLPSSSSCIHPPPHPAPQKKDHTHTHTHAHRRIQTHFTQYDTPHEPGFTFRKGFTFICKLSGKQLRKCTYLSAQYRLTRLCRKCSLSSFWSCSQVKVYTTVIWVIWPAPVEYFDEYLWSINVQWNLQWKCTGWIIVE